MILKFKVPVLSIILSIIFYSCEKEYSLEGNSVGGTAVFSFDGSPGACTNAVVTGTYQEGTPLGATNIVTISVNVSTAGTYTIATATVDGISFASSGTFATTGPQIISLTGSGTPTPGSTGTFSFTPGTNGCSFPITVSSSGGTSGGTAVYTLNGAPGSCTGFSSGGTYIAGTALGAGNFATVSVNVATVGTYIISTNTVNGISFSGTGTFTTTGTQPIQLAGSGTPLAGGVFNYIPGTNGCSFSITVGGSSGSAVFTFDGAPGNCTNVTIGGIYTAGIALTALNTIKIDVIVSSIGTYSITTPQVNGYSFSGSGSFPTIGYQVVTLSGTGIPTIVGVNDFTPFNNGCKFSIDVIAGTTVTDFLICTIDGTATTFNVNVGAISPDPTTINITGDQTTATATPYFAISLKSSPAIIVGTYNQVTVTNLSTYCIVGYNDGVSTTGWITGTSGQSGSLSVIVTSLTTNRIDGTFSGTLYDTDGTGSAAKNITLGQFSVPY